MATSSDPIQIPAENLNKLTLNNDAKPAKNIHLVVCTSPITGHLLPILEVVARLLQRGYTATFIAGEEFQDRVKATGAKCITVPPLLSPEVIAAREKTPEGVPRLIYDWKVLFVGTTGPRWETLKETLVDARKEHPDKEVVILTETFYMGHLLLLLGADLPEGFTKRPKVVNLHAAPYIASSIDTAPIGLGLPPDSSEEGRARNKAMAEGANKDIWGEVIDYAIEINESYGIKNSERSPPFDAWMGAPDVTLHLCPPSLEYAISDFLPNFKFVGALPRKPLKAGISYPSWWEDVTKGGKKIVTVTQGTMDPNYSHLIIPTIEALAGKENILVVAILGAKGAPLPSDLQIPSNARVIDYLPYDAILPYTDVYVLNAGYGGFIHGIVNGVPMVLAGNTEDKPEVSMRAEKAGVAVNLKTGTPSKEQVLGGIETVLEDGKYKKRVLEVKEENEKMNSLDTIEKHIEQFATPWS